MGQKTNTNIFQLSNTKNWKSKYFEKNNVELACYSQKDLEIRNFIYKFLKNYGLIVHECKLGYFNNAFYILISYHQNLNYFYLNKNIIFTNTANINKLKKSIKKKNLKKIKKTIKNKSQFIFLSATHKKIQNFKINLFLNKFIESLINFNSNKLKIYLILQQINNNTKQIIKKKAYKILKKTVINLKRYIENGFFREGLNKLFTCATNKKSAKLLASFIAMQLNKIKRHNYFLKFLKSVLTLFSHNIFSKFKGIKIKIKGKLNGHSRTKSRIIEIGGNVPVLSIQSNINFSEKISFTTFGTIGGASLHLNFFFKFIS